MAFTDQLPHQGALRTDLRAALDRCWGELGGPGDWLSPDARIGIIEAVRAAWQCPSCAERKAALSPYGRFPPHVATAGLSDATVHVVHTIVRDPGRISRRFVDEAIADGICEDEYVELVSLIASICALDAFAVGIGADRPPPPPPITGEPRRQREPAATPGPGYVATIAPENAPTAFADFYANESHFYIRRALTLNPGEARRFWSVANTMYMEDPRVEELDGVPRSITRAQMEFLAARASALLGCYY